MPISHNHSGLSHNLFFRLTHNKDVWFIKNIPMRCIVIDDEQPAIRVLKRHIERLPNLELVGTATNPLIGIALVEKEKPDVVFLDLEMDEMNGLDVIKRISEYTAIVLCSAYSEAVVRNYGMGAVDYLTKPIAFDRFELAVERVKNALVDEKTKRATDGHQ